MPASDYNPNIPQVGDEPSTTQPQLLLNWGAIQSLIDVDHADFASPNAGKHNKITFPVQCAVPAFAAGEVGLFSLLDATTNTNELTYYNVGGVSTPITASILSTGIPGLSSAGWAYLPSGILLKWGNAAANGNTVVPFPVAATIPVFNQVFSVQLTPQTVLVGDSNTAVRLNVFSTVSMTVYGSERTAEVASVAGFQYLAIGY